MKKFKYKETTKDRTSIEGNTLNEKFGVEM